MIPKTKSGFGLYEVISAMQKEIRRGHEKEAMFWALELESLNSKVLWNRLRIIASEDVGLANNPMAILIDVLNRAYTQKRSLLFVSHAILSLCRSPKSRIVDDFIYAVEDMPRIPIPDYAKDMHTSEGKLLGRGLNHFLTVGCKLENESKIIVNIYKRKP